MWKKVAIGSIGLWAASFSLFLYLFFVGTGTKVDERVEIRLLPSERALILNEMRQLLEGIRGIVGAVAENDVGAITKAARGSGVGMAQDINPALITKLPKAFKELGMNVHRRFDELAVGASSMSSNDVLMELHDIMGSCVGCHVAYKITE
ncbi:MAG: hypothetical protein R3C68_18220 [Myxococcota bacterium]